MAKEVKAAEELRDMILDRARGNPIFPRGMTIRVRATRETWAIDCVPPTISKVAHADCCELLTRIAMELRAEYDLQPSR
jgi:hypothetical protein